MQVLRPHSHSDGYIGDYCNGSLFQSHDLPVQHHKDALQIIVYFDEVKFATHLLDMLAFIRLVRFIHCLVEMCSVCAGYG